MDIFGGLPRQHFSVITADPPWHHSSRSAKGQTRRSPSFHYPTMKLADIAAMPVASLAQTDCHLFIWVPGPHLVAGLHIPIIKAWGFKPTAMGFVWGKLNPRQANALFLTESCFSIGMGYTTRKNAEFCVIGRRGNPQRISKKVFELIIAARREHSRKPDEFYRRVQHYAHGPYLELFAREQRPGWTAWGNETDRFGEAA